MEDEQIRERPIIFSTPMVRSLLAGTKTQTRRIISPQPLYLGYDDAEVVWTKRKRDWLCTREGLTDFCPYGKTGDRLWVRETWTQHAFTTFGEHDYSYLASWFPQKEAKKLHVWKPSIHMPRGASRILLEICEVRVQRLQEISEEDAMAEGVSCEPDYKEKDQWPRHCFRVLWDSINGKREECDWESSPWVWAISFRRFEDKGGKE